MSLVEDLRAALEGEIAHRQQLEQDRDNERMEYQGEFHRMRDELEAQVKVLEEALRRARVDLVACRDEMEVSTQEAFVDEAIARVDAALLSGAK